MFLDLVRIRVKGGDGGDGVIAWRRETFVPQGGPAGGDGGKGGDVIMRVDPQLSTLLDFRYRQEYKAERGENGGSSNRTGRSGDDLVLRVPPGTVARDAESGEIVAELVDAGEELVVAAGGRGGWGNARFATATNQAPRRADYGLPGEERELELELKLIADVGLVGEPNAGKSTFLAAVSAATPKIADYPFTTLAPNLGVVQLSDGRSFVVADIPGIIEGAHEGKGLGLQFLRHIERTRTLAVMIQADALEPQAEYEKLLRELSEHSQELMEKPRCVVFTKGDLLPPDWPAPHIEAEDVWGQFVISSVARRGLEPLLEALWARSVREQQEAEPEPEEETWQP